MMRRSTLSFWLLLCGIFKVDVFDLQCSLKTLAVTFNHTNRTGCSAFNVNIQSRDQVITSVNGNDLKSFNESGCKSIEIRFQPVHYIPQGLGDFFPDLEGLDIGVSETKEVSKSDLAQFPKLKQLYLHSTHIQSLPADLFDFNSKVLFVYFGNNKLTHVGIGIFKPLKNLVTAYFKNNPCINMDVIANQSQISSLVTVLESDCRNDIIDELTEKSNQQKSKLACEPFKSLTTCIEKFNRKLESKENIIDAASRHIFMISSNNYEKSSLISIKTFKIKCKFDSIAMSCEVYDFVVNTPDSKITEIFLNIGTKIDQSSSPIKKLLIIDQQMLFLPQNLAEVMPKLNELLITDSGLFQINQEAFAGLTMLTSLKITHNKIREISEKFMYENCNLRELNLTSNKIEIIAQKALFYLNNLEELDLSFNLLVSIHFEVFSTLSSLTSLKLNNNKLQVLSYKLFYRIFKLVSLDISNNQIERLGGDIVSANNNILEFRAANNKLKIIDQMLVKRLRKSQLIDLSGNDCINVILDENLPTGVKLNAMLGEIYLECTEDTKQSTKRPECWNCTAVQF